MVTKFNVNLEGKTLSIEGNELKLDDSLFHSDFVKDSNVLTLDYREKVHEDEMDKIDSYLRDNCPEEIQVSGGEFDDISQVVIYGDIEAYIR